MKPVNLIRKHTLIVLFSLSFITFSNAQSFEDILSIGPEDASTYLESYIEPAMQSFGVGMAGNWYNTAKPHKLLGFDLTVGASIANIPDTERLFTFNSANYQNLQYSEGNGSSLPTLVGGDATGQLFITAGSEITNLQTGDTITVQNEIEFDAPNGVDLEDLPIVGTPAPSLQIGIGLIKNTEVKIRFIPSSLIESDNFTAPKYFGIGVLHDIKQWIPGMKLMPFDMSAFIGWTRLEATQNLDVNEGSSSGSFSTSITGQGEAVLAASATTVQVLVSKKLAVLTPYAGVGFNIVKSSIDVNGTYEIEVSDSFTGTSETLTYTNPVALDFEGAGGPRLTVGARLKLLILTIHADYTLQKYNTFSAGIGLSIR